MRAVIDTNIVIRAVIKPKGSVGPVLDRLREGDYIAVYSEQLLHELLTKLALPRIRDKYSVTDRDVADLLAILALRGELVNPERCPSSLLIRTTRGRKVFAVEAVLRKNAIHRFTWSGSDWRRGR